jgi:hypothetical protein
MPAKKKTAKPPAPPVKVETIMTAEGVEVPLAELQHIAPAFRHLAVRADSVKRNPRNARLHGDRDLPSTAASLKRFGLRRPLEFDPKTRVLEVGNGRHEAATDPRWGLNWKWIAAVPCDLPEAERLAYGIVDNRTGEQSEWDTEALREIEEELSTSLPDFDLGDYGLSADDIEALENGDFEKAHGFAPKPPAKEPAGGEQTYASVFKLIITCRDEKHQSELIREFEQRGFEYTAPNVT